MGYIFKVLVLVTVCVCATTVCIASDLDKSLYCDMDYTLTVNDETHIDTARVTSDPPKKLCELAARGYEGSEADAMRIFETMGQAPSQLKRYQNIQEHYNGYELADDCRVNFLPSTFYYKKDREMSERYVFAAKQFSGFEDPSNTTFFASGIDIDLESIFSTDLMPFADGVKETYVLLSAMGLDAGAAIRVEYWDTNMLTANWNSDAVPAERRDDYVWKEEDVCAVVDIPVFLNGVRLKPYGVGTPSGIVNCSSYVYAWITSKQVFEVIASNVRFTDVEEGKYGTLCSPETALRQYESMLNRLLDVPDDMLSIDYIQLEYNVSYQEKIGDFSPVYRLIPVWSIYVQGKPAPMMMVHAINGSEVLW